MIYKLLYGMRDVVSGFNVFQYITLRTALATLTALVLSFVIGPYLIKNLRQFQIRQMIREEGPSSHQAKEGTPTMGGVMIIIAILIPSLFWMDPANPYGWIAVGSLLLFGVLGFIDDFLKIKRKTNKGLTGIQKFVVQFGIALLVVLALYLLDAAAYYKAEFFDSATKAMLPVEWSQTVFPFFKNWRPDFGLFYFPFAMVVIVATSNAVNLTDGLDGLAIGSTMIAFLTYTILAYIAGHALVANYLLIGNIKGVGELTIFCGAAVGASLGFLWFNAHPAEVFMGDVGSMSLGGAIGTVAVLIKQEIILVIVGGLFVIEALSVIIQVASFQTSGRRVFRMSPLHHHFELKGWNESKVVIRFWTLAIIFALIGLSSLKLR
jgi:phospho-N-acetylmuramoyl-pentapeptide-transferase